MSIPNTQFHTPEHSLAKKVYCYGRPRAWGHTVAANRYKNPTKPPSIPLLTPTEASFCTRELCMGFFSYVICIHHKRHARARNLAASDFMHAIISFGKHMPNSHMQAIWQLRQRGAYSDGATRHLHGICVMAAVHVSLLYASPLLPPKQARLRCENRQRVQVLHQKERQLP